MTDNGENTAPSIDELNAKRERLVNEVTEAKQAADVARQTFADAARQNPEAVETLLELSQAVTAANGTVATAERAVAKCDADIAGVEYQAKMADVVEAGTVLASDVRGICQSWAEDNATVLDIAGVEAISMTFNRIDGTMSSIKPTGENMPKPPSRVAGTGGTRGAKSKRGVTFTANGVAPSRAGEAVSCRDYVAACGDMAAPAAIADLAGQWDGAPVSYTNEARRLAAKNGDEFA